MYTRANMNTTKTFLVKRIVINEKSKNFHRFFSSSTGGAPILRVCDYYETTHNYSDNKI